VAGDGTEEVPVAGLSGEALVVPAVAALVFDDMEAGRVLLQRRDKPGEVVRGLLEVPTGKWRAGEEPRAVAAREVAEETGLHPVPLDDPPRRFEAHRGRPYLGLDPIAAVVGVEGAYPTLVVAFPFVAAGAPRPRPGETSEPRFVAVDEVQGMLADPAQFTGATYAVLLTWLGA
jgi:8-oxo-dGTP pyrophosphatase MutT (NUDIX family)